MGFGFVTGVLRFDSMGFNLLGGQLSPLPASLRLGVTKGIFVQSYYCAQPALSLGSVPFLGVIAESSKRRLSLRA